MTNTKLYVLVGLLTLGNVAFRVAGPERGPAPRVVSHLEAGDRAESAELHQLLDEVADGSEACRLVVAFNPDCPFCGKAAERERQTARDAGWGETLWITDAERPRLAAFADDLPDRSRHAVAPEAFQALDVEAVPALFMIDGEGLLRWVGPYRGDETDEELVRRCSAGTTPGSAEEVTR